MAVTRKKKKTRNAASMNGNQNAIEVKNLTLKNKMPCGNDSSNNSQIEDSNQPHV